ncbi:MAG: hypothetical protein M1816_000687 [Peltula sp. TS41687]|nr:MAG: hypothetical protein M1816_000687 [Peltula sp. TS41687]
MRDSTPEDTIRVTPRSSNSSPTAVTSGQSADDSYPEYAQGNNEYKVRAQTILRDGHRTDSKCVPCVERGIDCVVLSEYKKCALCTSIRSWSARKCRTSDGQQAVESSASSAKTPSEPQSSRPRVSTSVSRSARNEPSAVAKSIPPSVARIREKVQTSKASTTKSTKDNSVAPNLSQSRIRPGLARDTYAAITSAPLLPVANIASSLAPSSKSDHTSSTASQLDKANKVMAIRRDIAKLIARQGTSRQIPCVACKEQRLMCLSMDGHAACAFCTAKQRTCVSGDNVGNPTITDGNNQGSRGSKRPRAEDEEIPSSRTRRSPPPPLRSPPRSSSPMSGPSSQDPDSTRPAVNTGCIDAGLSAIFCAIADRLDSVEANMRAQEDSLRARVETLEGEVSRLKSGFNRLLNDRSMIHQSVTAFFLIFVATTDQGAPGDNCSAPDEVPFFMKDNFKDPSTNVWVISCRKFGSDMRELSQGQSDSN